MTQPPPHSRRRQHRAFTLLELIIVLVLFGIIAAIVIPQFTQVTERAETTGLIRSAENYDREVRTLATFDTEHADGITANPQRVTYLNEALLDIDGITPRGIEDNVQDGSYPLGEGLDDDGQITFISPEGADTTNPGTCDNGERWSSITYTISTTRGEPSNVEAGTITHCADGTATTP